MTEGVILSAMDRLLAATGRALATLASAVPANRPSPAVDVHPPEALSESERRLSGALMRVNHVGEICAQALYEGQALSARDPALRAHFRDAASEEADHLAWTRQRLDELGARPSVLNPVWYMGAFALVSLPGASEIVPACRSWLRPSDRWSIIWPGILIACRWRI